MDTDALREQIKAEIMAEMEATRRQDTQFASNLQRLRQSAMSAENGATARREFAGAPSENAKIYGTVLAAQMLMGLPGTGLSDDGIE